MRVMKVSVFLFVLSCIAIFSVPARSNVIITPINVSESLSPGGQLSFDFGFDINNDMGVLAQGFQSTINVTGSGGLTFDATSSVSVDSIADYWVYGNSAGAYAKDNGGGSYTFGDVPDNGIAQSLAPDDIMGRYVFIWDGTEGDYTFTLDLNTNSSFILQDVTFVKEALVFDRGQYPGGSDYFTIHLVPEPATLMLLGLGGLAIRFRRVKHTGGKIKNQKLKCKVAESASGGC